MNRCMNCPTPEGMVCLAQATGHLRFCDWAAAGGLRRDYVEANAVEAGSIEVARPAVALTAAEIADRVVVETCANLGGCLCNTSALCHRESRPPSIPESEPWPSVRWAGCLACVRAGEHSPRG